MMQGSDRIIGARARCPVDVTRGLLTFVQRCHAEGGVIRSAIAHVVVDFNEAGEMVSASGVFFDITDRALGGLQRGIGAGGATDLDRAIDAALLTHQAIKQLGTAARPLLLHLTEMLLYELGMQLAQGKG